MKLIKQMACAVLAASLFTKSTYAEAPLSAIDWLSDSILQPAPQPQAPIALPQNGQSDAITVTTIEDVSSDAVGLLPAALADLPPDLWSNSNSADISDRLRNIQLDTLPAIQDLIYRILLAELTPPSDGNTEPSVLLARLDVLLGLGALDQAAALADRAGYSHPEIFRRAFDISLLLRNESAQCDLLRNTPALSPTFTARIYCLARGGDWAGATLSLETGKALGFVTEDQDALLASFLELGLDGDDVLLPNLTRPSPLEFRIYEAIGRPLPTTNLPLAYAQADLHNSSGWKSQLEAAERLARTGAVAGNRLFALYAAQRPAASGGVWDRVSALQTLDAALLTSDINALGIAQSNAFAHMQAAELERPFARVYCDRLKKRGLADGAAILRYRICLLAASDTPDAPSGVEEDGALAFLTNVATQNWSDLVPNSPQQTAIRDGLIANEMPTRLKSLTDTGRRGEALLRAIELFTHGAHGDLDELTDALAAFRLLGLEGTARQAAIELLLLERIG